MRISGAGDNEDRPRKTKKWNSLCRMERKTVLWAGPRATSQQEIIEEDRLATLPLISNRPYPIGGWVMETEMICNIHSRDEKTKGAAAEELSTYPYGEALKSPWPPWGILPYALTPAMFHEINSAIPTVGLFFLAFYQYTGCEPYVNSKCQVGSVLPAYNWRLPWHSKFLSTVEFHYLCGKV